MARMTGDDLVTALVQAHDGATARAIADDAPWQAVMEAAGLLYLGEDDHGLRWYRNAVASAARE